jgi:beta-galactosidase/beta-glucuronidase
LLLCLTDFVDTLGHELQQHADLRKKKLSMSTLSSDELVQLIQQSKSTFSEQVLNKMTNLEKQSLVEHELAVQTTDKLSDIQAALCTLLVHVLIHA